MDRPLVRENLALVPFAKVLAEVWQRELSGTLLIRADNFIRGFAVEKGLVALDSRLFPETDFLGHLMTSGLADLISLNSAKETARAEGVPLVRALVENGLVEPGRLWKSMEDLLRQELFLLFDRDEGLVELEPREEPPAACYVRVLEMPALIMEGIRKMKNAKVIDRFLPGDGEQVTPLSPLFLHRIRLAGHERYFLELLDGAKSVGELLASSDLGLEHSRRLLFAFVVLGVVGTVGPRRRTSALSDPATADIEKLFGAFNAKFSYVYKYLSKEIGPVAASVIERAVEEARPQLDSSFSGMKLLPDGRIELKASLRLNISLMGEAGRKSLLRSMDELLLAEILAVKRILGPSHEAVLVRDLERAGETL